MLHNSDIIRLNNIIGETGEVYRTIAVKMGMPASHMDVMYTLRICGGSCPISHIVKATGISKQTINSALRKLEESGLVQLENISAKAKVIHFTTKGEEVCKKTVDRLISAENEIFESWGREEMDMFIRLSQKYLTDIKSKAEDI